MHRCCNSQTIEVLVEYGANITKADKVSFYLCLFVCISIGRSGVDCFVSGRKYTIAYGLFSWPSRCSRSFSKIRGE